MATSFNLDKMVFEPPEPGCVLYLPELPGAGSKIYDRSPYGNVGTITGAVWRRLPSGLWYLDFDGNDDYVDCGNNASLNLSTPWTVEAWVKAEPVAHHVGIVTKYLSPALDFAFTIQDSGLLVLIHYISNVENYALGNTPVDDSKFHHVLGLNDGTDLRVYLDGVLDGTGVGKGGATDNDGANLWIGLWRTSNSEWFKGIIAIVRLYKRALSAMEITSHYNQERPWFGV